MSPARRTTSLGRGRSRVRRNTGNAMLDLYSVKTQIDRMVEDERLQQADYAEKLSMAQRELRRWADDWPQLAEKINQSRTSWLMPGLLESPTARHPLPARPDT